MYCTTVLYAGTSKSLKIAESSINPARLLFENSNVEVLASSSFMRASDIFLIDRSRGDANQNSCNTREQTPRRSHDKKVKQHNDQQQNNRHQNSSLNRILLHHAVPKANSQGYGWAPRFTHEIVAGRDLSIRWIKSPKRNWMQLSFILDKSQVAGRRWPSGAHCRLLWTYAGVQEAPGQWPSEEGDYAPCFLARYRCLHGR